MPRQPRLVVAGRPHLVVQRGSRDQTVFFDAEDYAAYRASLAKHCAAAGCAVWGYCLMPTHVHLILVPKHVDGLRAALAQTHRAHSQRVNRRQGWRGHLWQERFHSFVMDEPHLLVAARYVERFPVRAGLVRSARDWRWSSARAHLAGADDELVKVRPLLALVADWRAHLGKDVEDSALELLRRHTVSERPLGSTAFLDRLEKKTGLRLRPAKRGRKPGPVTR